MLSDHCEQTGWKESHLESYEIIHSPAVGRLSITVCEACADFFSFFFFRVHSHSPISTPEYGLKDVVKFLEK